MRRRDFITLLGGAAASWPLTARAQQAGNTDHRVSCRRPPTSHGAMGLRAFVQRLSELGCIEGRDHHDRVSLGGGT